MLGLDSLAQLHQRLLGHQGHLRQQRRLQRAQAQRDMIALCARTGLAWPGLAWPGLAWPGLAWPGRLRRERARET
ncbi:hypothetical protein [Polaromonas sp. CG_23.6]|uniref:hypothetical protein n=1 Tax=Polaromonas sp. CG_23.6 TaxID=2760709 RepID=UPI002473B692|nr:hypothetical protein [Polaromonas sp. CG_23.6]MDH6185720.1 hypothetical protein [Polaromonas sp. CG_23.6]